MSKTVTKKQLEDLNNDSLAAREVVREIMNFGVNERQKVIIIQSLAMTLEDNELMRALLDCISDIAGDKVFISKMFGE
jgi:archaellum biogenesis ATPase FlaH